MGLEYVDIFYSHRFDPDTPLRGDDGSARQRGARRQGALRRASPPTRPSAPTRRCGILRELGTPLLIHQPSYSLLNRWIESELLDVLEREGVGAIVFSPLAQGLLSDRYLEGISPDSRVQRGNYFSAELISEENLARVRALNEIAAARGQTLAQMAIAWTLRDPRVTSALLGASSVEQLEQNVASLQRLDFAPDELAEIDRHAHEGNVDLWAASSSG